MKLLCVLLQKLCSYPSKLTDATAKHQTLNWHFRCFQYKFSSVPLHSAQSSTSKPEYTKSSEFRFFPPSLWRGQECKHPQLLQQEGTLVHQQNQTGNTKWAFLLFILCLLEKMKFISFNQICQKSTEDI